MPNDERPTTADDLAEDVRRIVSADPLDVESLDRLLPRIGLGAAPPMFDALTTSDSSHTRRILLDRIVSLGSGVGPLAAQRLDDASWYVQRNMLVILGQLPERPPDFNPQAFIEHTDSRVRREALRILLQDPALREGAICGALADPDEQVVRLALTAAQRGCPEAAVSVVGSLASTGGSEELRVAAIRALAGSRSHAALDVLVNLVQPKRSFFWRIRLTKTPEYRAAVAVLQGLADQPRVRQILQQAGELA